MKKKILINGLMLLSFLSYESAHAISSSETTVDQAQAGGPADRSGERPLFPGRRPELSGDITLQQVIASTVEGSPQLASYSWEVRASEARILQAGLRPNPELSVSPENFIGSGAFEDQVQYQNTLQLSQLIELGEKRELRTEAASATRDRTQLEYESKRVEVLGDATIDFIDVVSAQEEGRLAELTVRQAHELKKAVDERLRGGLGAPLEEKRANISLSRAENVSRQAALRLQAAKQKLAANWGSKNANFHRALGELYSTHPLPGFDSLIARLESAPERKIAVAEEKVRAAEAAVLRAKRVSDATVSGAWRQGRNWDDQTVVAGLSIPLKIFDRSQGDIAASEAQFKKSTVDTASVEVRLHAVAFGLYQEILQAKEQSETMAKKIVPSADEALTLSKSGFARGLYSQLDVLEAQRTLIEVRREQIESGARYHRLVAELERLLGTPI